MLFNYSNQLQYYLLRNQFKKINSNVIFNNTITLAPNGCCSVQNKYNLHISKLRITKE